MKYSMWLWSLILSTGVILSACGGGGGKSGVSSNASSSSENTTIGVITGFGSIFVNGCEYNTDTSTFSVDDNPSATEDNLRVGNMVKISSSSPCNTTTGKGIASSISFSDDLEGVVDSNSITAGTGTLVIMGQIVTINSLTIFEDNTSTLSSVDNISAGHVVEVSGYSIGTGTIVASRIEVKYLSLAAALSADANYHIEVKGLISNFNANTQTFSIGGLSVNYGSAIIDDNLTSGLNNSIYVEVKATTYTPGATLIATKVELEGSGEIGHQGSVNHEVELRGLLTAYDATKREVTIGAYTFVISDSETEFRDDREGALIRKLSVVQGEAALASATIGDAILKGNGKYNAAGDLIAQQIRWKDSLIDHNECKGSVSGSSGITGLSTGTFTVNTSVTDDCEGSTSMTVTIDNSTIMHDSSSASISKFNLSHLRDGDTVEVHVDPSTFIATRLERK